MLYSEMVFAPAKLGSECESNSLRQTFSSWEQGAPTDVTSIALYFSILQYTYCLGLHIQTDAHTYTKQPKSLT